MEGLAPPGAARSALLHSALAAALLGLTLVPARAADGCAVGTSVYRAAAPLVAPARSLAEGRTIRVLAVGSSSTEGVGATAPANGYPARLEAELRAVWAQASVRNAGVGGETTVQTLARLEALVAAERYDLVLWQVGTNDAVRGDDEAAFRGRVERGIAAIRASGAEPVLIDPQYFPTIRDPERYARYVALLGDVGATARVAVFSRYALMHAWGERSPDELRASLAADGFHMADRGYGCLADLLAGALVEAVRGVPPSVVAGARGAPVMATAPQR